MPSVSDFFSFIKKYAGKLPFVRQAVALYFCAVDPEVSWWAKGVAGAAVAYLILPTDAIFDVTPVVGFTDDAAVIAGAVANLGGAMTKKHYQQADQFLNS
ncbi:MAG: DUF1232 domain-containing protein [Ignavibacteriales bacterium]|nr:DUF1232 domain-containing protein [Ignavibacteriales bacterium]